MIDGTHEIDASERVVGDRTLAAGEARVVAIRRRYDTTVEDLWDACTNGERIPRWFLPVSGDLRLGGRYQLEGNAGGTIQTCEPPHRFTATWEYDGDVTWIEVTITAPDGEGGGAELLLEHIAHVDDARWLEFGPGAVGVGWDLGLLGLSLHLASGGEQVDAEAVQAWLASGDGLAFVAGSSDRWGAAHRASGADADLADTAAARTKAAYTGEG